MLLDEGAIDEALATLPASALVGNWHACTHTTFSPNVVTSQTKTNIIPDVADIDVDIRTLPGRPMRMSKNTFATRRRHLRPGQRRGHPRRAVDPVADRHAVGPDAEGGRQPLPHQPDRPDDQCRLHRRRSSRSRRRGLLQGLLSPTLTPAEFGSRFHGHNERIDLESLDLTTATTTSSETCSARKPVAVPASALDPPRRPTSRAR